MKVDRTLCLHCGSCSGTCPGNAIFLEETYPVFDEELCVRCGLCEKVCPVGAIISERKNVEN
ncbi:MAG: 4Fe-4S binding protein [Candidatus Thermoplasmatota archaeon]|nr:4Fe-4S binding protein [Candidatus Thermoplasmatota archaeon]